MKIILFHRFTTGRLVLLDIFVWYCKGRVREWTLKVVFFLPGETEVWVFLHGQPNFHVPSLSQYSNV